MIHFEAPWSRLFKGITLAIWLIFLGLAIWAFATDNAGYAAGLIAIPLALSLFVIRGYDLEGNRLYVRFPVWTTEIDLSGMTEVTIEPSLLRRSLSIWSTRGFYGVVGLGHRRRLGVYRAYVTDQSRTVLIRRHARRPVAISPHDPTSFISSIRGEGPALAA